MAQFYQTAEGGIENADSFMYQPPVELMKQALDYQNQGITNSLASANLYNNLNINYIDDEREREVVNNIIGYYSDKSKEIQDQILQDPSSWQRLQPSLQALGAELQKDMTTGDISKIQGSYASLQKWMGDNAEMKTKNPALYQQGLNHYLNGWRQNENRSLDSQFTGTNLVSMPDIMQEKYRKIFDDVKANAKEQADGTWIYQGKSITKEKLLEIATGMFMSDEAYKSYSLQQTKFGDRGWVDVDANGNPTPKSLYLPYSTEDGHVLTQEELKQKQQAWELLTPEQQKEKGNNPGYTYGMNKTHEMYTPVNTMANSYSFMESSMKENPYGIIGAKSAAEIREINAQGAVDIGKQNNQAKHDLNKLAQAYEYNKGLASHKAEIALDYTYMTTDDDKVVARIESVKNAKALSQINSTIPLELYTGGFSSEDNANTLWAGYSSGNAADVANYKQITTTTINSLTKDADEKAFYDFYIRESNKVGDNGKKRTPEEIITEFGSIRPAWRTKQLTKAMSDKGIGEKNIIGGRKRPEFYQGGNQGIFERYIKDKVERLNDKLQTNTNELNYKTDQVTLYPFSDEGNRAVKQYLNGDKDAFIVFDSGDNSYKGLNELGNVKNVISGSLIGNKGGFVRVEMEDGSIRNVMPSQGKAINNGYKTTMSNMIVESAKNLGDRDLLRTVNTNHRVKDLQTDFARTVIGEDGTKTIIKHVLIGNKKVPLPIKQVGEGEGATFLLIDPIEGQGPDKQPIPYNDIFTLTKHIGDYISN